MAYGKAEEGGLSHCNLLTHCQNKQAFPDSVHGRWLASEVAMDQVFYWDDAKVHPEFSPSPSLSRESGHWISLPQEFCHFFFVTAKTQQWGDARSHRLYLKTNSPEANIDTRIHLQGIIKEVFPEEAGKGTEKARKRGKGKHEIRYITKQRYRLSLIP